MVLRDLEKVGDRRFFASRVKVGGNLYDLALRVAGDIQSIVVQ